MPIAIKGVIEPDYIQNNKFILQVSGAPPLRLITVGGLEEELDNPDLPDRTTHTGGRNKPLEFDVSYPLHHIIEHTFFEAWFQECKQPVSPTHKKIGTLVMESQMGARTRVYTLLGLFPQKRGLPDLELDNDGEMVSVTWTMKADDLLYIPTGI